MLPVLQGRLSSSSIRNLPDGSRGMLTLTHSPRFLDRKIVPCPTSQIITLSSVKNFSNEKDLRYRERGSETK